jgi:hypothetical protein
MRRVLAITVAHPGNNVSLIHLDQRSGRADLVSGKGNAPKQPLRLRRGYLSVLMSLDTTGDEGYLRVLKSSFQYSTTGERADWVFRYDFLRSPDNDYPGAHLQVNGDLVEMAGRPDRHLPDLHFPVGRVSLEGVVRLLVEQFDVPANETEDVWRPVLSLCEREFLKRAHQPLSGPDAA